MRMLSKRPKKIPKGYTLTMHMAPNEFELVTFPATATKPVREKWCHKVLGYSLRKSDPFEPWRNRSESELIREINKELKNAKKQTNRR